MSHAPPCAGITRSGSDGRRIGCPPSQPEGGAPVASDPSVRGLPHSEPWTIAARRLEHARLYLVCDVHRRRLPRARAARRRRHRATARQASPGRGDHHAPDGATRALCHEHERAADRQRPPRPGRRDRRRRGARRPGRRTADRRGAGARRPRSADRAVDPHARADRPTPTAPTSTTSASARCTRPRPSPGARRSGSRSCATRPGTRSIRSSRSAASSSANANEVARAGGARIAVVRALTEVREPEAMARALRRALDAPHQSEAGLGAT